jgi:hypothetical protein
MSDDTYVTHEQPFDSVLIDFDKLEQQAASGIYVLPIVFAMIALLPFAMFIAMTFAWNVPLPFCLIPLVMLVVLGGVAVYLFRKLKRYRIARAALQAWAQPRSFVEQGRAYVGVVAGRRCAAMAMFRREGKTEYAFEGFALLVQLTSYSNGGLHLCHKLSTQEEAIRLLDSGFEALLRTYCQTS